MRQHCGACKRPYALAFDRCPACGAPAGTRDPTRARPAPEERREPRGTGEVAELVGLFDAEHELSAEAAPARTSEAAGLAGLFDVDGVDAHQAPVVPAPEPSPELGELTPAKTPRPELDVPDLDLGALPAHHPIKAFDLELDSRREPHTAPHADASHAAPHSGHDSRSAGDLSESDEPPPDSTPVAQLGWEAWEEAAAARRGETPEAPAQAARVIASLAPPPVPPLRNWQQRSPLASGLTGPVLTRIVTALGVTAAAAALLLYLGLRLVFGYSKVEVSGLAELNDGRRIELVDGVAEWASANVVDPESPIELASAAELRDRSKELSGRLVSVNAEPLGAYMYKQYRVGRDGQREELPGVTRVYLPLTLDNTVWAISPNVKASTFDDPEVKQWVERSRHSGVLQLLADNVDLDDIRNPESSSRAPKLRSHVPDNAVAIVSIKSGGAQQKYTVARLAGTQGRFFAIATGRQPGADETLFGEIYQCPSKTCQSFTASLPTEPAGVLVLGQSRATPWAGGLLFFGLLGLFAAVGGELFRRRLEA